MPIVPNPLPLRPPRDLGTDRTALHRLWDAASDAVGLLRALFGGKVFEWHEDEIIDVADTSIAHGLNRRPFGFLIVRRSAARAVAERYDQWTDSAIVLFTVTGSQTVSFVLF